MWNTCSTLSHKASACASATISGSADGSFPVYVSAGMMGRLSRRCSPPLCTLQWENLIHVCLHGWLFVLECVCVCVQSEVAWELWGGKRDVGTKNRIWREDERTTNCLGDYQNQFQHQHEVKHSVITWSKVHAARLGHFICPALV